MDQFQFEGEIPQWLMITLENYSVMNNDPVIIYFPNNTWPTVCISVNIPFKT